MSLVIVGSLAFDSIETPHARRERIVGGSGSYCALAASFFTRPKVVGVVGRDFPAAALNLFRRRGIDLKGVEVRPGKTFFWEGRYGKDPNLRTTIRTELNVFKDFRPVLPESYRRADILFLANIDPDLQEEILNQARNPRLVAMDTIELWIKTKRRALLEVLRRVDVFFSNDQEVRMLTGEINLVRAGRALLEKGPRWVVIKKGEHGVLALGRGHSFCLPGNPTETVTDPTGAGDSFAGGFLGSLDRDGRADGRSIRRAAAFGSVMASFAIEDFGVERFKKLRRSDIEERYRCFKNLVRF
ncbi:MAG: sugar kinase [Candidatus Aminicenantes bacterium RBG_13_62_12]|nr:MAG: sugar kinase [Candidatus Aminicenantes bacterium RBG_13_62_12]